MARKHRRKKKYYSVADRPSFKVCASIATVLIYGLLYFLVVILMENPGIPLNMTVPCVLLLIWIAIKQRHFWWLWTPAASICLILMLLYYHTRFIFWIQTAYWIVTYAMIQWLIVAASRAKVRSKKGDFRRHHRRHTHEPAPVRPRDELLEKLFADVE